jgi:hypothetical protein
MVQTIFDIKAHGGKLSLKTPSEKMKTSENKGIEFIIKLKSS